MTIPANPEAHTSTTPAEGSTESFEAQVNTAVKQLIQTEDGLWEFPSDTEISPDVKYAAGLEKRRRDTESALGKSRQQLKAEEAVRKALENKVSASPAIDAETQAVLEELKFKDPDAWREQVNDLETKAKQALDTELQGLSSDASQQAELERRTQILTEFNKAHADAPLTDDVLASEIPPRLTKQVSEGKITFEQFLVEAHNYVSAVKVIGTAKASSLPNLGAVGGGDTASDEAQAVQDISDYDKAVF